MNKKIAKIGVASLLAAGAGMTVIAKNKKEKQVAKERQEAKEKEPKSLQNIVIQRLVRI